MKTATCKRYPLITEVWPAETREENTGKCPWLMATCGTCMYERVPEDYWQTGDDRSYCTYMTQAQLKGEVI